MTIPSENVATTANMAQRAVRGSVWLAIGSYFNVGFGFLANLVLMRLLLPEHYGIFSYAMFFVTLLNLRARIPFGYGFIQRKEATPELIGTNFGLNLAFSVAGLLLVGIVSPVIYSLSLNKHMGEPWLVVWVALALASSGIIDSVANTASSLLNREFFFGWPSLANMIAFPLSYVPAFLFALQGWGVWSLLAQNILYVLLQVIFLTWVARHKVPHLWFTRWRFDWSLAKELLGVGITVSIGSFASYLVGTFDNFLIGTFVGVDSLGFYDRAYRLANWPTLLVTGIIAKMTIYTYARLQDDPVRLKKAVSMSFWLITSLGLPIALALFVAAPDLIAWWYTPLWLPSTIFLRFLVVYGVVQPLIGDAGVLFIAIGKPKLSVIISFAEAAVLVVFGTLLTVLFGAYGTCVAVGLAFLTGLALTYRFVRRIVPLDFWQLWGMPCLAALLTVTGYWLLSHTIDMNAWSVHVRAIAKSAYAAIAYAGIIFAMQPKNTTEKFQYVWTLWRKK
ncbi:MAG: oligosaccharide flippase family protein [Chloroflexota bacterium]